jgi:hypothetical protein
MKKVISYLLVVGLMFFSISTFVNATSLDDFDSFDIASVSSEPDDDLDATGSDEDVISDDEAIDNTYDITSDEEVIDTTGDVDQSTESVKTGVSYPILLTGVVAAGSVITLLIVNKKTPIKQL